MKNWRNEMLIGKMIWKIGDLDFDEQIRWIRDKGFPAISFHTTKYLSGNGCGLDLDNISTREIIGLQRKLESFKEIDIHAPFDNYDVCLVSPNIDIRKASVRTICKSIRLASEISASTVTIHPGQCHASLVPEKWRELLTESLKELQESALQFDVLIGVEVDTPYGYETVCPSPLSHIGLTLDSGHIYSKMKKGLTDTTSIGKVIEQYHNKVFHLHLHDYKERDHLPIGKGVIDFADIISSLKKINYKGSLCLELNPEISTEQDIIKSKEIIEQLIKE